MKLKKNLKVEDFVNLPGLKVTTVASDTRGMFSLLVPTDRASQRRRLLSQLTVASWLLDTLGQKARLETGPS
jgi:hypothetical protein